MAALDFPMPTTIGQIYTQNGKSWRWDGVSWKAYNLTGVSDGILGIVGGGTGRSTISSTNTGRTSTLMFSLLANSITLLRVTPSKILSLVGAV